MLILALWLFGAVASAQVFTYVAFGDSITEGKYTDQDLGGYPGQEAQSLRSPRRGADAGRD